ncbi:MAG: DUF4145 domain-containing protein [Ruminococcaceae bacterium]|nr:DUF4145 domain-containing protein [Oscillospiraceae bacterium]
MKFPEMCPYCGKDNSPKRIQSIFKRINSEIGYCAEHHDCVHCGMPIFIIKEQHWKNTIPSGEIIVQYYPCNNLIKYPVHVKTLSPDAFQIFEQTLQAHANGLNTLVGAGLRMTLERLVLDYLTKIQGIDEKDVLKLKLDQQIERMNVQPYTKVCSQLLRIYGNREIHITHHENISVKDAIITYRSLCDLIEAELIIKEANARIKS